MWELSEGPIRVEGIHEFGIMGIAWYSHCHKDTSPDWKMNWREEATNCDDGGGIVLHVTKVGKLPDGSVVTYRYYMRMKTDNSEVLLWAYMICKDEKRYFQDMPNAYQQLCKAKERIERRKLGLQAK